MGMALAVRGAGALWGARVFAVRGSGRVGVLRCCWDTVVLTVWGIGVLVLTFGVPGAGALAGLKCWQFGVWGAGVLAGWGAEVPIVWGATGAAHGPTQCSRSRANEGLAQGKQRLR